ATSFPRAKFRNRCRHVLLPSRKIRRARRIKMNCVYPVKPRVAKGAHLASFKQYEDLYQHSLQQGDEFWLQQAKRLDWIQFPQQVSAGDFKQVDFTWVRDGKLNVSLNCL